MNSALEAVFFAFAGVLTLASLWRELHLQHVITVAAITFAISALASWVFNEFCWWLPLIVLNSRGVSRLVLFKWRERPYYGWWIMGLTCVLSTLLAPGWIAPALALVMQLPALPWLIKRRPDAEAPTYFPFVNWVLLALWMLFVRT